MLPSKIRNKARMSALATPTQHCTRYAVRYTQTHAHTQKKKKVVNIWEEIKMSLFTDDMILYVANPKESRYTHTWN